VRRARELLTREQFEHFMLESDVSVLVPAPWQIIECPCGDVNCRGWRLVAKRVPGDEAAAVFGAICADTQ